MSSTVDPIFVFFFYKPFYILFLIQLVVVDGSGHQHTSEKEVKSGYSKCHFVFLINWILKFKILISQFSFYTN